MRRWFIINWRKQGYCGLHDIRENESKKIGETCKEHGCVCATIVHTKEKESVASSSLEEGIPKEGSEVEIHSPCCNSQQH